jgi:hypothetical protein
VGSLHVALLDGFDDDTVEVLVGDQVVLRRSGVTTMTQISRADEFDIDLEGATTLVVRLPDRELEATVDLPGDGSATNLGVTVAGDEILAWTSAEPFRFA